MTDKKSMHGARARARGARAGVSVNFLKFSPCMVHARRTRAGSTVYPPSRTLELLAFDVYYRFDTSAFFLSIKRGFLLVIGTVTSVHRAVLAIAGTCGV